jgi:seryl-tRNA(Sec) selenium transferase
MTISVDALAAKLRDNEPPIFVRIAEEEVLLDFRTIGEDETRTIELAIRAIFSQHSK